MRYAAVDIGTNSTRLLVAEVEGTEVGWLDRRVTVTGLGKGVDQSGLRARGIAQIAFHGERTDRRYLVESSLARGDGLVDESRDRNGFEG